MEKMENENQNGGKCAMGECGSNCQNSSCCPSCSYFRNCCWICKIAKVLFVLLLVLALLKFTFGGMRGGWHTMKGGMMDGGKGCVMMSGGEMACGKKSMMDKMMMRDADDAMMASGVAN